MSRYEVVHRRYVALAVVAALIVVSGVSAALLVVRDARHAMELQVRNGQALAASERAAALGDAIRTARGRLMITAGGPRVAAVVRGQEMLTLRGALDNVLTAPAVTGMSATTPDGTLIAKSGREPSPSGSDEPVFRSSADRSSGFMTIRAPAHDEHGTQVAWFYQELSLRQLNPQFIRPFPELAGAAALIAHDGTVVMATGDDRTARVTDPDELAMVASRVPKSGSYRVPGRSRRIAAAHPVAGTDLVVLVAADAAVADKPAAVLVNRVVALFLLSLVVIAALIAVGLLLLASVRRQLVAAREAASRLAQTDPLTGVGNRRALDDAVTELLDRDDPIGLVIIDLDDLKLINDTCGHASGDEALRRAAAAISSAVRPNDLVLRFGGDEFVILLTQGAIDRVDQLAARVRAAVAAIEIEGFGHLSVSTGIDVCPGRDVLFGLNRADELLYQAKRRRRSDVSS